MRFFLRLVPLFAGWMAACDIPPSFVEASDIDDAMVRGHFKTVCKGLEMKDDEVRRYATMKLLEVKDPISAECICTHLADKNKGWDAAVAAGLKGTKRDDLAKCFADLVDRPDLPRREAAVVALANIPAPAARAELARIAAERPSGGAAADQGARAPGAGGESAVRVRAVTAIGGDPKNEALLLKLLSDPDPAVRAAAAEGLSFKDEQAIAALGKAARDDQDGVVRGTALVALKKAGVPEADKLLCAAMMDDPSAEVRKRAIAAFRGTKRSEAIACLRKRAFTYEEDAGVRDELLAVLKSSPSDDAAKVLCDAIPFWMRSYLKKDIADKVPGTQIIKAQNDRDWQHSYECVERAYRHQAGYSCYARMTVALWFRELGGGSFVPTCPGYSTLPK